MSRWLLLATLLAVPALAARTEAARSAAALQAESTSVVHGRVVAAEAHKVRHQVRTTYTIAPIQTLAGEPADTLVIDLPGGHIGSVRVEATGVPVWTVDDEVVVFMNAHRPTSLDGLLTVHDGVVSDPHQRPASAMPTSLTTLSTTLARPSSPEAR